MPQLIKKPTLVKSAGNMPKKIEEFVGKVNTNHTDVSVAWMVAPSGWEEPGQKPEFREITLVFKGELCVEYIKGVITVKSGQAVITEPNEWIRYSTPGPDGAEYIAICIPAFSPDTVHRDE